MTHELKINPEAYEAQRRGIKTFEIRRNDRGYKVGDTLLLRRFDGHYSDPARILVRTVTYIADFPYGLKPGYVVLGTREPIKARYNAGGL